MSVTAADLTDLHRRVVEANSETEMAIAAYEARKKEIRKECRGDPGRMYLAKQKDGELAERASAVAFRTSQALRLAGTLQIELLGLLVRHNEQERKRWGGETS